MFWKFGVNINLLGDGFTITWLKEKLQKEGSDA
jgi:hypothetical protein